MFIMNSKIVGVIVGLSMLVSASPAFASVNITLSGGSVTVKQGSSYSEPGYSAFSTVDGDVTGSVSVSGIDTSRAGNYTIGYNVTDSALSTAQAFRSVSVVGGGSALPWCSSPNAPGWNVSLPGGGCGGKGRLVLPGAPLYASVGASLGEVCPIWFPSGCLVN